MNSNKCMSLEDRALVKIAITICSSTKKNNKRLNFSRQNAERILLEIILYEKIDEIKYLPEFFKSKLKVQIRHTITEICRFYIFLKKITHDEEFLMAALHKLCWTEQGLIECKKSALKIVKDRRLDKVIRYKLACMYCLKRQVSNLWKKLSTEEQSNLLNLSNTSHEYYSLIGVWTLQKARHTQTLREAAGRLIILRFLTEYKFLCTVQEAAPDAVQYYFNKIPHWRKNEMIRLAFISIEHNDQYRQQFFLGELQYFRMPYLTKVIWFLFLNSENGVLKDLFEKDKDYLSMLIQCLLEWPFREIMFSDFERLILLIKETHYTVLIDGLQKHLAFALKYDDDYYLVLLINWWQNSTGELNKMLLSSLYDELYILLCHCQWQCLSVFFKKISAKKVFKSDFMCSFEAINLFNKLKNSQEWDSLKYFIKEFLSVESVECLLTLFIPANQHGSLLENVKHFDREETAVHICSTLQGADNKN